MEFVCYPVAKLLWLLLGIIKDTKIKVNIHRELTFAVVWGKWNKELILLDNVGRTIIDKQKSSSKIGRLAKILKTEKLVFTCFDSLFEGEGNIYLGGYNCKFNPDLGGGGYSPLLTFP